MPTPEAAQQRIVLHVGAPKTGTTYLQSLMSANVESLRDAGVNLAGTRWSDQVAAVRDVLGFVGDARQSAASQGAWTRLTDQIRVSSYRVEVVSMEFLSFANAEQASAVVAAFAPTPVHLVLTIRDARAALPAQWQTECSNGSTLSWPDYLAGVQLVINNEPREASKGARVFQRTQGIPRMLRVWSNLVPADQFKVVVVPPRGAPPRLLWERFASVLDIDPDLAPEPPPHVNTSLGHASAEFTRRLNERLSQLPKSDYNHWVKRRICRDTLAERARVEAPLRLPRAAVKDAEIWNKRVTEAVRKREVSVVGELAELHGPRAPRMPWRIQQPTDREVSASAVAAWVGLLNAIAAKPKLTAQLSPLATVEEFSKLDLNAQLNTTAATIAAAAKARPSEAFPAEEVSNHG